MAVIEVDMDILLEALRHAHVLADEPGKRRSAAPAEGVDKAQANQRRVIFRAGQPLVVARGAGQVGQRQEVEQGSGLGSDPVGGNGVVEERRARSWIVDRDKRAGCGRQLAEVASTFGGCRDGAVLVKGRRGSLARQREKEEVFLVMLQQPRDVWCAGIDQAEGIGRVGRLTDGLPAECKIMRIEGRVRAVPEEGAMRLVGIEMPERAAKAAATAAAEPTTPATATSSAKAATTAKPTAAAE